MRYTYPGGSQHVVLPNDSRRNVCGRGSDRVREYFLVPGDEVAQGTWMTRFLLVSETRSSFRDT